MSTINRQLQDPQQETGKAIKALDLSRMKVYAHLASNPDQLKYWIRVGNFNIYIIRIPAGKYRD